MKASFSFTRKTIRLVYYLNLSFSMYIFYGVDVYFFFHQIYSKYIPNLGKKISISSKSVELKQKCSVRFYSIELKQLFLRRGFMIILIYILVKSFERVNSSEIYNVLRRLSRKYCLLKITTVRKNERKLSNRFSQQCNNIFLSLSRQFRDAHVS